MRGMGCTRFAVVKALLGPKQCIVLDLPKTLVIANGPLGAFSGGSV